MGIHLTDGTQIACAWIQKYKEPWCEAYPLHFYDDCEGPLWLFGHEFGPSMLIRAASFESAWESAIDESPPIDPSEIPEAHGFDGWDSDGERTESEYSPDTAEARFNAAVESAERGERDYPDLLEGYEYQPNCTGTGIVNVSDYAWLRELTPDDLDTFGIGVFVAVE